MTVISFASFQLYVSEVYLLGRSVNTSIGIYTCNNIWRYVVLLELLSNWPV